MKLVESEDEQPKGGGLAHPLLQVPGGGGEQEVDLIAECVFEVVAGEAEVDFEMAAGGFDSRAAAHQTTRQERWPPQSWTWTYRLKVSGLTDRLKP